MTTPRRWMAPACLSGVLLVLAQPPFSLPTLSFLALVPLAAALGSLPAGRRGGLVAAECGLLFGVVFWGAELIWVPASVGAHFAWAYSGYALLLVLLGGLSALMAWVVHRLHRRHSVPLALALPLGWVAVEWTKAHFPLGLEFPWLGLGVTLSRWPDLLGIGEWVGESGVSFWLASANGFLASGILALRRGTGSFPRARAARAAFPRWGGTRASAAALGLVSPFLVGPMLGRRAVEADGPRVLVLGTAVAAATPADSVRTAGASLAQARARITASRRQPWDLVVVPEAFFPMAFVPGSHRPVEDDLVDWHMDLEAPLMFGARGQGSGGEVANSVFLLPEGAGEAQRYDKSKLVPGMELGAYAPGPGGGVMTAAGWTYGPLLCYESLFGGLARAQRLAGAQVLVNLSNDVWFGSAGGLLGSLFLGQHPAHLVLRAVENRVPVARAANGGYSFLMDSRGRIVSDAVSPLGGLADARLSVPQRPTLFTRVGDVVGPGSVLASLFLLLSGLMGGAAGGLETPDRDGRPSA